MSTGPISLLPCVPNLTTFLPDGYEELARNLKCTPPNGNQLYSLGFATFQVGKYLTETVVDDVFGITGFTGFTDFTGTTGGSSVSDAIARAEFWFGRLAVFLVLPWLLIFIALFIYFGITGVMSGFAAIIFIVMTLLVAGFSLFLVIWDARYTVLRIRNDVGFAVTNTVGEIRDSLNEQIDTYGTELAGYMVNAYILGGGCTGEEDPAQVCCGFNPVNPGCFNIFTVCPSVIPTSATGTFELEADFPSGYTAGFIVIPPELNGGTGTSIPLTELVPMSFAYTTTNQPNAVQLQAVFVGTGLLPTFEILSPTVFIIDMTGMTGLTGLTGTTCGVEVSDVSSLIDDAMTEDTLSSMAQLQQTLQQAQLLQEGLQRHLAKPRKVDQSVQRAAEPIRGGCRSCFKRPIRAKVAPICPNGNCQ